MNEKNIENKFLETFKKKVISECIKDIYKKYRVVNDDGYDIDIAVLEKSLTSPKRVKRCRATTGTLSQCTRNATEGSFCKTHMHIIGLVEEEPKNNIGFFVRKRKPETVCESNLVKKFIGDTFYLVDTNYVYDSNFEKVGYVDDGQYVLTDDPFVLDNI